MKGGIYGVDVKLVPMRASNGLLRIVPVGIELNGVDFGTDFFKYPEGRRYYQAYAKALGDVAQGRPIFVHSSNPRMVECLFERAAREVDLNAEVAETKKLYGKLSQILGPQHEFDYSWLDDLLAFDVEKLSAQPEYEAGFYALGGQQAGVEVIPFSSMAFGSNWVEFRLLNGKSRRLKAEEIGVVHSTQDALSRVPEAFRGLFLNTRFVEDVLESKALTWFTSTLGSPGFSDYLPPTMPYGLGVTDKEVLIRFLDLSPGELVVKKRGTSYCGTGVEILLKEDLMLQFRSQPSAPITAEQQQALSLLLLTSINLGTFIDDVVTVYQTFYPSVPLPHPKTGMIHDGCARVVVYSPPSKKPVALGAQWRLAPRPMDDDDAGLEERLRANLSRGATAVPMSAEHEAMTGAFAERFVSDFEATMADIAGTIGEIQKPLSRFYDGIKKGIAVRDVDALRYLMFSRNIAQRFKNAGLYDTTTNIITSLPGLSSKITELARRLQTLRRLTV